MKRGAGRGAPPTIRQWRDWRRRRRGFSSLEEEEGEERRSTIPVRIAGEHAKLVTPGPPFPVDFEFFGVIDPELELGFGLGAGAGA